MSLSSDIKEQYFKPISQEQVERVWRWRNSARVRHNMHYDKAISFEEHAHWFDALLKDKNRECWIYYQHDRPIGVLNFTDVQTQTMQWGCYLGETDVLPGSGLVLEWAALEYALNKPKCVALEAQVLSFNTSALKLHKLFEYELLKIEKGGLRMLTSTGELSPYEVHFFRQGMSQWGKLRNKVLSRLPKSIQHASGQIQFLKKEKV